MSEIMYVGWKAGGSSMADPVRVAESFEERQAQDGYMRPAGVVSASGKGNGRTQKTTDVLYQYADAKVDGDTVLASELQEHVLAGFVADYDCLGSKDKKALQEKVLHGFQNFPEDPAAQASHFASLGEEGSAFGYALLTGAQFVDSPVLFGNNGRLWRARTINSLASQYRKGVLSLDRPIVIPGFYGYGPKGQRFTLDRGGSDRTGALVNRALALLLGDEHVIYENLTDRPIHSADWNIVEKAQIIRELKRRLVREGAHGGNPVLQGDTIVDLDGSELITYVKSAFDVGDPGTRVIPESHEYTADYPGTSDNPVVATTGRRLVEISIDDLGMSNERGYLKRVVGMAAAHGLSIEHIPASQDYVTITLHEKADEARVLQFEERLRRRAVNPRAAITHNIKGVVYLVGDHLRDGLTKTRTLGQVCTLAARAGYSLNDVSDERSPSLALLVDPDAVEPLQQLLHNELIAA